MKIVTINAKGGSKMKKLFLGIVVCALLLGSGFFFVDKASSKTIELKLAHFMSPKHVQHTDVMLPFAEAVKKATDGRVTITIYPGGALGRPPQQYDAAVTGIVDIAFGLHSYTPGKFPLVSVLELPFMVTSGKQGSYVLWKLYEKFPQIKAEHPGVKILWLWAHDTGQILTNKPVRAMSDLKGLKLRCPSATQKSAIQAWGATPVMMPIPQLYESLQKGVVEGTVLPVSAIYDFNLHEVAKYLTVGDFYVSTFFMAMNKDAWNKISSKDQGIIEGLIGKKMSDKAGATYDAGGKLGYQACKKAGIDIYSLPPDELAKWKKALMPLHEKWVAGIEAKGLPGKAIYNAAIKFAKEYR